MGRDKHAVLWQNGKTTDLGTLGGKWSTANDINEQGEIVGWSETKAGYRHAVLWQNGHLRDLGTNGQQRSEAFAINDRSQIIGVSFAKSDRNANYPVDLHAFVWRNGRLIDLGKTGHKEMAINERGQVTWSHASKKDRSQGFLWANGRAAKLATPKWASQRGPTSIPTSINESGQIVGWSAGRPCLWQHAKVTDLGSLKGGAFASRINERGEIVGSGNGGYRSREVYAVLWRKSR